MAITNFPLLTFWDCVDHVLDQVVGGDYSPRNMRQAVRAIQEAYAEIPMRRKWRYFYRPFTISTVASQTSSTITYTASTRSVTLASGTWPTDATKYAIYIDGERYTVATRSSSTVLILDEKDAPTSDIAAGTSYALSRDTYELPDTLREVVGFYDADAPGRPMAMVDPVDILHEQRVMRGTSQPLMYAVYRSEQYASAMAIHFAPSPASARMYQGFGLFWPQPLSVFESSLGTVSTTSGSTAVTGTSTAFTSAMVGSVIRISASGSLKLPTDLQGEIDRNRLDPYAYQGVVKSVTSTTALVLEQECSSTLSTSGYRISSRIDIEPGSMRNAFLRCCEARFATQERKESEAREARYEKALAMAMIADQRLNESRPGGYQPHNLADVAGSVDANGS